MDIKKALRLINKIQTFLDNGNDHDISRLEKDLLKSYVLQLYDAVTDEQDTGTHKEEEPIRFVEHKMPKRESAPRVEIPQVREREELMPEIPAPIYTEDKRYTSSEKEIEVEIPVHIPEKTKHQEEIKSYQYTAEPVKENTPVVKTNLSQTDNDNLRKLFEVATSDEMSGRFSHAPVSSIESAMGLNERIFTLNELFGGDKKLFDETCARLNHLNSFADARTMLISGVAKDFNWAAPERQKMAEQFLRIVSRRYPKSTS